MITPSKTSRVSSTKPSKKLAASSKGTRILPDKQQLSPYARGFVKRVLNTTALYSLWQPKTSFVVAVSGGPDSLCLLDILFRLSEKYQFRLHIAHVNYGLRGKDSDLDETLVRERALFYHLPCTVFRPRKRFSNNLEEELRHMRYAFFEKLRQKTHADIIAVAHNENDQAETFLLRLLRGSGMQGLAAMRPKHDRIIRPLIQISRDDILRYLTERRLAYREDRSNTDVRFLRNRIRHELLPLLEAKFQPRAKKILAQTAALLAEDYAAIEQLFPILPIRKMKGGLKLSRKTLLSRPDPVIRYQLRTVFTSSFKGRSPEKGVLDEIIKLIKSHKNKAQVITFRGLKLERRGDTVRLLKLPL